MLAVGMVLALLAGRQSPSASAGPVAPGQLAAGASERILYRLDLKGREPYLGRIEGREFYRSPDLPESWQGFCWKEGSVGEVLVEPVDGSPALGLRNLSGQPTCQLITHLSGVLHRLVEGRRYVVRLEYRGEREAKGWAAVRQRQYRDLACARLGPTNGRWQTLEIPYEQAREHAHDLAFGTWVNGPDTTLFIRSVVLAERP
jgi:hypothetical protein